MKKNHWFVNNLKSGDFEEKCKKKQNCLDHPTCGSQAAMNLVKGHSSKQHLATTWSRPLHWKCSGEDWEMWQSMYLPQPAPPLTYFLSRGIWDLKSYEGNLRKKCSKSISIAYLELSEFVFPINLNTNVTGEIKQNLFLQPLLKEFREWKTTSMKNFRFSEQTVLPPSLSFKENLDRFDLYRFVFWKRNAAPF